MNNDIDVQIFVSKIKNFFENNPEDLKNLISLAKKDLFFSEIERISYQNKKEYGYPELHEEQIQDICYRINNQDSNIIKIPIMTTKYGEIILN